MDLPALLTRLDQLDAELADKARRHVGFPDNFAYDYAPLLRFFQYSVFDVGDPYADSAYRLNAAPFEREVLAFFADLYDLPEDERWGYVTSGGTEGNIYGLFQGRELYPDATLYLSEDTHYSVHKAARLLRIPTVVVPSWLNGELDYHALMDALLAAGGAPKIVNLNIGTTMKGAIDNIDIVLAALRRSGTTEFYIHCDAALFGLMIPFFPAAPPLSFAQAIDSIAVSGHKFLGCPVPCGVVLTRRRRLPARQMSVEYIRALDSTILGSRSGLGVLLMWYALKTRGRDGLSAEARACTANAEYLREQLESHGVPAHRNALSNIVYFRSPSEEVSRKWSLASQGDISHVVVMQHVDRAMIAALLADLIASP